MSHFIAVDPGKYNTKIACFDTTLAVSKTFKIRTKMSDGTFSDDMYGKNTMIVQVDGGPVYKIGAEAKTEATMETTKQSEIHKVMTLAAIALCLQGNSDDVTVAIGMPLQIASYPDERIAYKDFILGADGQKHTVKVKTDCNQPPITVTFSIKKRLVYPEGIGVIYSYPKQLQDTTAVIDIGNLNTNNVYIDHFDVMQEHCFTDEAGGKIVIAGLASTLEAELGRRVNEDLCASTLLKPYENRHLTSKNGNKEIEEKSRNIIDKYLLEHVRKIRQKCDTRHWPLDFMNIVCIGGTSKLLSRELRLVFGEDVFIPASPEYVNVQGFLKKMCAEANIDIDAAVNSTDKAKKAG